MKRWLPVLLFPAALFAFVLARRSSPGAALDAAVAPSASPDRTIPEDPALPALLWVRPSDASPGRSERSLWLDPGGHQLREESGLFFLHAQAATRLEIETASSPLAPCPRGHTPFPTRTLQRALLRAEGLPGVELLPRAESTPSLAEETHTPLAVLDHVIFFRTERIENPCDEQPRYLAAFRVLRVNQAGVDVIHTESLPAPEDARTQAAKRLNARLGPLLRVTPGGLSPTMILPDFSGEKASWSVQLTAKVPWEFSHGGWGSETASVLVARGEAPPWITASPLPAVALRYAREHPEETVVGVQRMP